MKILIAYATKTGTARECAQRLGEHFTAHDVVYADLEKEMPDVAPFDAVIVGSHVRASKIHKRVKQFVGDNEAGLRGKKFALYLCCCFSDAADDYFTKNFSETLLERSLANLCFGGEVKMDRQKGIDKLIMKIALRAITSNNRDPDRDGDIPLPAILPENIRRLADAVKCGGAF